MYLEHFQLQEKPFALTPDTQFFMAHSSHTAALNTTLAALEEGEGFIKIIGEVGTGKTLLCRKLLASLEKTQFRTAYIPNPWLSPTELKLCLAQELGVPVQRNLASHALTRLIFNQLLLLAGAGMRIVLIVDEAQSMPRQTIETLRLLTNLETEKRKLLQVVMLGQPELDVMLSRKDLRQLKQRIIYCETLRPFDGAGVKSYINHRLFHCGSNNPNLFSASAIYLITQASGGIARLINILCHKALICSYGKGAERVHGFHAAKAIADTPECRRMGKCLAAVFAQPWLAPAPAVMGVQR